MGIFYDTMYGKNKKEENGKTETVPSSVNPTIEDTGIKSTPENPALDVESIKSGYASSALGKSVSSESDRYFALQKEYLDKYLERGEFSYNVDADKLYQQYRNQALEDAKKARRNATAEAAGLTGGYGSTYASMAGNAAYSDIMDNADAMMPEFMELARQKYDNEGAELLSRAELAGDYASVLEKSGGTDTREIAELLELFGAGDSYGDNGKEIDSDKLLASERAVNNASFKYDGSYKDYKGNTTAAALVNAMLEDGISRTDIIKELKSITSDDKEDEDGYRFSASDLEYIENLMDSHEFEAYLGSLVASDGSSISDYYNALMSAYDAGELTSDEVIYALTSWEDKSGRKLDEKTLIALMQ